jgi:hypothetical protein
MFDTRDQHGPSILDELKVAEAERNAVQTLLVEEQRDHAATRETLNEMLNAHVLMLERQRPVIEAARAMADDWRNRVMCVTSPLPSMPSEH